MGEKGLVAGLNEGQSFGCESEVFGRGEVGFIGAGVSLVEVVIIEIWMRVAPVMRTPAMKSPTAAIEQHSFGRHVREE